MEGLLHFQKFFRRTAAELTRSQVNRAKLSGIEILPRRRPTLCLASLKLCLFRASGPANLWCVSFESMPVVLNVKFEILGLLLSLYRTLILIGRPSLSPNPMAVLLNSLKSQSNNSNIPTRAPRHGSSHIRKRLNFSSLPVCCASGESRFLLADLQPVH